MTPLIEGPPAAFLSQDEIAALRHAAEHAKDHLERIAAITKLRAQKEDNSDVILRLLSDPDSRVRQHAAWYFVDHALVDAIVAESLISGNDQESDIRVRKFYCWALDMRTRGKSFEGRVRVARYLLDRLTVAPDPEEIVTILNLFVDYWPYDLPIDPDFQLILLAESPSVDGKVRQAAQRILDKRRQ